MKNYIKNLKGFYKTHREKLLKDYQEVKDKSGWEYNSPFELFVIALCEDEHSEELYNWVSERWTKLAEEYVALGLMNPSVRDNYGVKSDLFMYILWCYTQEQLQTTN
jgi:hypothetical protein